MLIALLGRGIQHPSAENNEWAATPDLEVCDEKGAHLAVRVPENDEDPLSLIGGGELNVLAGALLTKQFLPELVVSAYGARSRYLNSLGAPSESHVMNELFRALLKEKNIVEPTIEDFDEAAWKVDETGTRREIHNILTRAVKGGIKDVALVTVAVHTPRTSLMTRDHIANDPAFKALNVQCYASEFVLMQNDPTQYAPRVEKIFRSKSYVRNMEKELRGMNDLLAGKYKSISSVI